MELLTSLLCTILFEVYCTFRKVWVKKIVSVYYNHADIFCLQNGGMKWKNRWKWLCRGNIMEKVGSKFQLLSPPPVYRKLSLHHMWNVCKRIMEKRDDGYVDPEDWCSKVLHYTRSSIIWPRGKKCCMPNDVRRSI